MAEVLSAEAMRRLERRAMESGAVSGRALMERAGTGAAAEIRTAWPGLGHALVLAGPGNNGGDGFVIARHLHEAGWRVELCFLGAADRLPPDAAANHAAWAALGPVHRYDAESLAAAAERARTAGAEAWVVVDALFGIGQRAPLEEVLAPALGLRGGQPEPRFAAIDLPTGYDTDSGAALAAEPMPADLVITFHARKPAHARPPLSAVPTAIVDIGL